MGSSQLSLKLSPGPNTVKVEAIPSCKGSYEAVFYYADRLAIAPNPFGEELQVQVPETGRLMQLELFNVAGALLLSREWVPQQSQVTIPVPQLPPGIYLVRIRMGGRDEIFKVYRQ